MQEGIQAVDCSNSHSAVPPDGRQPDCPMFRLPNELVLRILSELNQWNDVYAVAGVSRHLRALAGQVKVLKPFHTACEAAIREFLFPDDKEEQSSRLQHFRSAWDADPFKAVTELVQCVRSTFLPGITTEQISLMGRGKSRLPPPNSRLIDIVGILEGEWACRIQRTLCRGEFTISYPCSPISFHALLSALSKNREVTSLKIHTSIDSDQLNQLLHLVLEERLCLREFALRTSDALDLRGVYAVAGVILASRDLQRVALEGVSLARRPLSILLESMGKCNLTHLSLQLLEVEQRDLDSLGNMIVQMSALQYLSLSKMTDRAFLNLLPYLMRCGVPKISFRDGQLTNAVAGDVVEMIKRCRFMTHLDLVKNYSLFEEGTALIIRAARKREDLSLSISDNMFQVH